MTYFSVIEQESDEYSDQKTETIRITDVSIYEKLNLKCSPPPIHQKCLIEKQGTVYYYFETAQIL